MSSRFHPLTFLRNLKWAFVRNGVEDRLALERRVAVLEKAVEQLGPTRAGFQDLLLLEEVLNHENPAYGEEIGYCRKHGRLEVFPYERAKDFPPVDVRYDAERGLSYVLHEGKRLYYPASWGKMSIAVSYRNAMYIEGILGEGCLAKSPHKYLDDRFPVKARAVVCDFGAAEGLVGLHFAEGASRLIIGECDEKWLGPLKASFSPYMEKTTFVTQPLGMGDDKASCARILTEMADVVGPKVPFFLKFDIEGAERFAIREAEAFFTTHPDVTVVCAAYHRQDDAEVLEKLFKEWGYETAFSDGAMLFLLDRLAPPYFRHGLLHAKKG